MKIEISYHDTDHIEITPDDIADCLSTKASDKEIEQLIRAHVDGGACEQPWPAYQIRSGQLEEAIAAVRKALRVRLKR